MATKASSQLTILDITDAYNVILTSDAYVFPGTTNAAKAGSCTTQVLAYRGSEQVAASVVASEITKPTGITVSVDTNTTAPTITITAATTFTAAGVVDIPVHVGSGTDAVTFHKKFSVSIAFTGSTGTYATSVMVGNESVSIPCDKDGKTSAAMEITIPFAGYSGTSRKACTLTDPTLPSGMTKKSNTAATTSADGSFVITVASGSNLGGTASGEVTLSFSCNSMTFVKKFSWAKSLTGATGGQGGQGNPGVSATSVVCGNEAISLPCTLGGLVKAAQTIVIPFAGYIGTTRAACTVSYSTLPSGVTLASNGNKAATTSADGSLTFNVAANANLGGANVFTGDITLTFTCNSQTFVKKFTWSKAMTGATGQQGEKGDTGDAGNDAIQIVIISSNGLIFKNTSIQTTLTAHVYKGGVEVTGNDLTALGAINWYKDGGSTAVATGTSLTIGAGDVDNLVTYEARLEA